MRVVDSDDFQDAVRDLDSFGRLAGFDAEIHSDAVEGVDALFVSTSRAEIVAPRFATRW